MLVVNKVREAAVCMGRNLLGRGAAVGPKEGVGEQGMILESGSSLCVLRDVWFVMNMALEG